MYKIHRYTYRRAQQLGVRVRPSKNTRKKIDVFDKTTGKHLASVGALGMNDYPTFIKERGLKYAQTRRRLYKQRHEKDRHRVGSAGYYADQLLW
jgi:hypothetical protein